MSEKRRIEHYNEGQKDKIRAQNITEAVDLLHKSNAFVVSTLDDFGNIFVRVMGKELEVLGLSGKISANISQAVQSQPTDVIHHNETKSNSSRTIGDDFIC